MILIFLFTYHFSFVKFICIWVSIESFVIEILRFAFSWNPSMTLWFFVSLLSERINLFLKSKELIFEKFRTFFITRHNTEIFRDKLFMIFHCSLENLIKEFSQVNLFPFYSCIHKFASFLLQERVKKSSFFDLNILSFFWKLLNLFSPLSNGLTGINDVVKISNLITSFLFLQTV